MSYGALLSPGNRLLETLPLSEYQWLYPKLELVALSAQQVLYSPDLPIQSAYFPCNSIVSLFTLTSSKRVEVATIGNEGVVGLPLLLGTRQISECAIVQVPGWALRLELESFAAETCPGSYLYTMLLQYAQILINQIIQTLTCNQLHSLKQRCSCWLLMAQDRLNTGEIVVTQKILAQSLGARRTNVSLTTVNLRQAGLINYHRGKISILNYVGLEAVACQCYQRRKQEFDRLFRQIARQMKN